MTIRRGPDVATGRTLGTTALDDKQAIFFIYQIIALLHFGLNLQSLIHRHTARWCPMLFLHLFFHVFVFSDLLLCFCVIAFLSYFFFTTEITPPYRLTSSSSLYVGLALVSTDF